MKAYRITSKCLIVSIFLLYMTLLEKPVTLTIAGQIILTTQHRS